MEHCTAEAPGTASPAVTAAVHGVIRSPGDSLDAATLALMGTGFGADLSGVRIHSDAQAASSAAAVDAAAYTVGEHVVFGAGHWAPRTPDGRAVLAHELAHVLQARAGGTQRDSAAGTATRTRRLHIGAQESGPEREAARLAATAAAGRVSHPLYMSLAATTLSRLQKGAAPTPGTKAADGARTADPAMAPDQGTENLVVWEAHLDHVWSEAGDTHDPVAVEQSASYIHAVLEAGANPDLVVDEMRKRAPDLIPIRRAFDERRATDLRTMAIERLPLRKPLVRILAFLYSGRDDETYAQLGLAIIPPLTRDAELARIFGGFDKSNPHQREILRNAYELAFAGVHKTPNDTLEEHLKDDLSNPELDKYLILLRRDLTPADELHLATTAMVGTDKEVAIRILQTEYFKGVGAFQKLKDDWETGLHQAGFVDAPLEESLKGELYGEEWQMAQAVFNGFDRRMGLVGEFNAASWEGREIDAEAVAIKREDIDLQMLVDTFNAATTGGWGWGAGTNEEQVYQSLRKIREIWEERIARAYEAKNPGLANTYRLTWERQKAWYRDRLEGGVVSEMGGHELVRAKLEMQGPLSLADRVWLAWQETDEAKMLDLVTDAWVQNEELTLRYQAEHPSEGSPRPPFSAPAAAVQGNPVAWKIAEMLRADTDHLHRGARRLKLDLEGTAGSTARSDLDSAYRFLQKVDKAQALDDVLTAFFELPGPPWKVDLVPYKMKEGSYTPRSLFVDYLRSQGSPFEFSVLLEDVKNLVRGPAASMQELVDRAETRAAAARTGSWYFDRPLDVGAGAIDWTTGEDTQEVAKDALARLTRMAEDAEAHPDELNLMMAMAGAKDAMALGQMEYDLFKDRLEDARSVRRSIVEAFGTIVDVAGRSLLVTIIGPLAGAGLLSALGAFTAGMLVREGFLQQDYELFSAANLSTLLEEVATFGFDALGFEAVIAETFSAGAIRKMFKIETAGTDERLAKIVQETLKASGSKLFEKSVANAIGGLNLPSSDELASRALNMVMLGGLKSVTSPITKRLTIYSSQAERLRTNMLSIIVNGPPAKAALPTVLLKEFMKIAADPNFVHMTPGEIAGRLGAAAFSSVASAMSVTLALSHVQEVQARDARRWGAKEHEMVSHMVLSDPALGPAYQEYVRGQPPDSVLPPHKWIQTIESVTSLEAKPTTVKEEQAMSLAPRWGGLAKPRMALTRLEDTDLPPWAKKYLVGEAHITSARTAAIVDAPIELDAKDIRIKPLLSKWLSDGAIVQQRMSYQ